MAKNNIGDWFQAEFWNRLRNHFEADGLVHEFVDTRQAARFVRAQPSDFMVKGMPFGHVHFVEVKASEKHDSLRSCFQMVRDQQCAFARKWSNLQELYSVWFYSEPRNMIEVWDGMTLAVCRAQGTPLPQSGLIDEFPWDQLDQKMIETLTK
jgi:hypothetical protein